MGVISGLPELADEISSSRRVKGSVAYVSNQCASAALWLSAQTTQLIAQPSSNVGSVGVMCIHFDCSQQLAAEGVRPTIIASTPQNAERSLLSPHGDFVSALGAQRKANAGGDSLRAQVGVRGANR